MFGRGGKIIVVLKPAGSAAHSPGPVASSGFNSLRFVFKNGGEEDFYKKYADALSRQTWKRTSSSSSSAGSRSCSAFSAAGGGAAPAAVPRSAGSSSALEKRFSEQNSRLNQTISQVSPVAGRPARTGPGMTSTLSRSPVHDHGPRLSRPRWPTRPLPPLTPRRCRPLRT